MYEGMEELVALVEEMEDEWQLVDRVCVRFGAVVVTT